MVKQSKVQQILEGVGEGDRRRRSSRRGSRESLESVHYETGEEVRHFHLDISTSLQLQ